jgi:hypothetical protein
LVLVFTLTFPQVLEDGRRDQALVLVGHDAINQALLLRQIDKAEEKRQSHYYLTYQDRGGGFYEIEFGLRKGSGIGEPV